jgi:ABC-type arginine transport system permease subunit
LVDIFYIGSRHGAQQRGGRMNLFKTFAMKWWQTGVFKAGMLALGIAIGAYWHEFFGGYFLALLIVAAVCLAYVSYIWWKQ